MRFILLTLLCFFLSLKSESQSQLHHKWILMSIDNLSNGVVKQVGQYVIAELIFDTDSTYKGNFCNPYHGKAKFNSDRSCEMKELTHTKRACMGYSDVEAELFRLYPLVNKYLLKNQLLYLFTSDQRRLVFKYE